MLFFHPVQLDRQLFAVFFRLLNFPLIEMVPHVDGCPCGTEDEGSQQDTLSKSDHDGMRFAVSDGEENAREEEKWGGNP